MEQEVNKISAIKKIINIILNRLNTVVDLGAYAKIYPNSTKNYLIWEIITQKEPVIFGVIIKDNKAVLSDVLLDVNTVKNKFLMGESVDGIEGVVEITQDAVMNLLLQKTDVFGCEFFYQSLNLYSNSINKLRSLLYLIFSQEYNKLVIEKEETGG